MNKSHYTPTKNPSARVGAWLIGAQGDIAATLMTGTRALARGLTTDTGLTTALPPINRLPLVPPAGIRFGGIDIRRSSIVDSALGLYTNSRTISRELLEQVGADLEAIDKDIADEPNLSWDPGVHGSAERPLAELIAAVRRHISEFRARHGLDRVVVVNLMSSGPEPGPSSLRQTLSGLDQLIRTNRRDLVGPSICYAYAAIAEGCPYINFTPNAGTGWGAIHELADLRQVPFFGDDGKTGETLIKTALARMFAMRNLRVLSWEGVNLLGNSDGRSLNNPRNREAKLRNKERVLSQVLGYNPHAGVTINFVPSLGDWKTAWDLIHFRGFLDVPMTMQFTWQGCDSILAAPLVLDLIRLSAFAASSDEYGPMHHLAVFFKNPIGVEEMDLHRQFGALIDYVNGHLMRLDHGAPSGSA